MKTNVNKNWRRRNLFLAIQIAVLTLAFSINGFAQDISQRISNTESLFKQMEVEMVDTNFTHKWNQDSSRWELYNREISLYKKDRLLIGMLNERWDDETKEWENFDRTVKSYDEKDKLIENLNQKWDANQDK